MAGSRRNARVSLRELTGELPAALGEARQELVQLGGARPAARLAGLAYMTAGEVEVLFHGERRPDPPALRDEAHPGARVKRD